MTNKDIWHLVFIHNPNGIKEVAYAHTDQFRAQKVCTYFIRRFPNKKFSMSHISKFKLDWGFRTQLRQTFKF